MGDISGLDPAVTRVLRILADSNRQGGRRFRAWVASWVMPRIYWWLSR